MNKTILIVLSALSLAGAAHAAPVAIASAHPLVNLGAAGLDTSYCHTGAPLSICGAASRKPVAGKAYAGLSAPGDDELALAQQSELAAQRARAEDAAAPVPEPHTFVMILIGLILLGFNSSRREASDKFSA